MLGVKGDLAVRVSFRHRVEEIKDDIAAGRIKFYNAPPEWTDQLLEVTALNCVLLLLADRSKFN